MFGMKKRKARKELDEIWQAMDMNCRNNYKESAQEELALYEERLEESFQKDLLSEKEYEKRKVELEKKKAELKGYDHKQHIGW